LSEVQSGYRPEISGLRAVSILAVVGYHAGVPGFGGGFIGVDIFFVISGCLIIGQIVAQLEQTAFSFPGFLFRRVVRILPAFLIVLAATCVVAPYVLVTPTELDEFGKSAVASSFMFANHFFLSLQGYFDSSTDRKPLLHMWSLAVEEQFYIVAPAILMATYYFTRHSARIQRMAIGAVTVVIIAASFAACVENTQFYSNYGFFLMPSRAWEFAIGGAIPFFDRYVHKLSTSQHQYLSIVGLAAILIPTVSYGEVLSQFPSFWPAIPVLGAAILISSARAFTGSAACRALSARSMELIGLVSYSWYLWHWPILSLAKIYSFEHLPLVTRLVLVGVAFLLSLLTYHYVEEPLTHLRKAASPRRLKVVAISILVLCLVPAATGASIAYFEANQARVNWAKYNLPERIRVWPTWDDECSLRNLPDMKLSESCTSKPWIKTAGLLLGDSHAMTSFFPLRDYLRERSAQLIIRVDGACPPLLGARMWIRGRYLTTCTEGTLAALSLLKGKVDFAILKAFWWQATITKFTEGAETEEGKLKLIKDYLGKTLDALEAGGVKRILIVGPTPFTEVPASDCVLRAIHLESPLEKCGASIEFVTEKNGPIIDILREIAASRTNIRFIDPTPSFCSETGCKVIEGQTMLYIDGSHLTAAGEKRIYDAHLKDLDWLAGRQESLTDSSNAN
jgi:peptidoglycan/LPS O-acetylase OafA/YrhL